jgi:hypothetical protein
MLARCRKLLDVSLASAEGGEGEDQEERRDAKAAVPAPRAAADRCG